MDYVATREQLRSGYRPASEIALRKEMRSLDRLEANYRTELW